MVKKKNDNHLHYYAVVEGIIIEPREQSIPLRLGLRASKSLLASLVHVRIAFSSLVFAKMTFGRIIPPLLRSMFPVLAFAGFVVAMVGMAVFTKRPDLPYVSVAFIGNSMLYYNDLPRLMEQLGDGHITQDSCLHGDASISTILVWGNGMYQKFMTGDARAGMSDRTQYDFGACTVPQLLFGYDENLATKVQNANYGDDDAALAEAKESDDFVSYYDGSNPCLRHENYYSYLMTEFETNGPPSWDYVVINDNTRSPARYESRQEALEALNTYYIPWLQELGATPILISTYGYWSPYRDMGGLFNVPTFTSLTYQGYLEYADLLEQNLPASQKARIAKVGWAFLLVWEENQTLWNNLFHVDKIHASPAGTYLEALVIYHTIFGAMPPRSIALRHDSSSMWEHARLFAPMNHRRGRFPTPEEEMYLYNVATRICVHDWKPKTLISYNHYEAAYYTPNDDLYRIDDLF